MTSRSKISSAAKAIGSKGRPIAKKAAATKTRPALPAAEQPAPKSRYLLPHESLSMPSVQNGAVVDAWGVFGQSDLSQVIAELKTKSIEVADGKMRGVEALLFDQAMALQTIFTNLSIKAARSDYLSQLEPLLRMALKAQNQSRMTLETLAVIKNPPVVFARQANINNGGQQQVNNGVATTGRGLTHAPNTGAAPTELSKGIEYVEGMDTGASRQAGSADVEANDTGAARAAGRTDQRLEAVGAIDGPAHRARQGDELAEPLSRGATAGVSRACASAYGGAGRAAQSDRPPAGMTSASSHRRRTAGDR